ncbi:cation:dicarboxylase symporter family transporter [Actinomadura sp. NPDC049753]|uniref:cation:dicarboxylate symporter family transporter n=1 Tax=Actinomadura sp. NPDC049753 TaxID=3154739 RepID=UPI003431F9B3
MAPSASPPARTRVHHLYLAVVAAVVAGAVVGLAAPDFAQELKPIGTAFVDLIKMMISPIIFCTIVLGIGSVARAAEVGRAGAAGAARRAAHRFALQGLGPAAEPSGSRRVPIPAPGGAPA